MSYCKQSAACVGESVILVYCAAAENFTLPDDRGVQIYLADGKEQSDVGVDKEMIEIGEYDEAWYARKELSRFPSSFPAAYADLRSAVRVNRA